LAERNACDGQWAAEEWVEWYERNDLSKHDMVFAHASWKTYFEDTAMHISKRQELEQYRSAGTRTSKAQARQVFRRAFRAWQQQTYGHAHLATSLLKYATKTPEMLLQDWHDYTLTPEYQRERERAQNCAEKDLNTKLMLNTLRRSRRQVKAGRANAWWTQYFKSGALDEDLARLTQENGFGRMHFETGGFEDIRPSTFETYLTGGKDGSATRC
jgi:hypothetical protein